MGPCKLGKLKSVVSGLEGCHEKDKAWNVLALAFSLHNSLPTNNVEHEADESMMCRKWQKHLVN